MAWLKRSGKPNRGLHTAPTSGGGLNADADADADADVVVVVVVVVAVVEDPNADDDAPAAAAAVLLWLVVLVVALETSSGSRVLPTRPLRASRARPVAASVAGSRPAPSPVP